MKIEHIETFESDYRDHFHVIKVKEGLKNVKNLSQMRIISLIFDQYGMQTESMRNLKQDLIISNETDDTTPEQTIGKTRYILRRLSELLLIQFGEMEHVVEAEIKPHQVTENKLKQIKLKLYKLLLEKDKSQLTDSDVNLMFDLVEDEDIQKYLEMGLNDRSSRCCKRNSK